LSDKFNYIAVDLGAESGRVMLASLREGKISLQQVHRFANSPIEQQNSLRWDFQKIFSEIKTGIKKAFAVTRNIESIGIDTWGVDFGLIDQKGALLENPYHYRDRRNEGVLEKACKIVPKKDIYFNTGIQFLQFNSLYQLLAYKWQKPDVLSRASRLLFMPDLFVYFLTGKIAAEYTIASTSQMMDMTTGRWSQKLLQAFDLPAEILPDIIQPGTKIGILKKQIAEELNCKPLPVIAVGSHDTTSAVAAIPAAQGRNWAYLSSGTWSLLGAEIPKPVINDTSFRMEFTNEGGVQGSIRLLKNIVGLWLVQQCRSQWSKDGLNYDYEQLTEMAANAEPSTALIDTEYKDFLSPGNMPEKINQFLKSTKQQTIVDKGQMVRVILESLALHYRQVLQMLEELLKKEIDVLHVVGGGSKNRLLNQFTADAAGKKVIAGPVEATVIGNVIMQAVSKGHIDCITSARKIVAASFDITEYTPRQTPAWQNFIQNLKINL
jgi:rhamnulokinase